MTTPNKAPADLDALRKTAEEARVALEQAETESATMTEKARSSAMRMPPTAPR